MTTVYLTKKSIEDRILISPNGIYLKMFLNRKYYEQSLLMSIGEFLGDTELGLNTIKDEDVDSIRIHFGIDIEDKPVIIPVPLIFYKEIYSFLYDYTSDRDIDMDLVRVSNELVDLLNSTISYILTTLVRIVHKDLTKTRLYFTVDFHDRIVLMAS